MLTFKKIALFFGILTLPIAVYDWFAFVSPWIYAGIILAGLSILFYGSKHIQANFYITSLCKGSGVDKEIALTFDDGPDAQVTPLILDILKKYNVKATFFIIGSRGENNPGIIQRINKEGHLLGGHSYSHGIFFDLYPEATIKKEMHKTETLLYSLTGKKTKIFRPPYGVTNPPLARSVKAMGYISIGWSVKSNDTVLKDPIAIVERLKQKISAGDIVLFHDNKTWNVESIEMFLKFLQDSNYTVCPLDKLLKIHAYDH
jgi:peptidoglycan-N-acetylglucosamine deacetylase